jgi:putative endonuclease
MTQEGLESRLLKHNTGAYNGSFTAQAKDWELYYLIECEKTEQAVNIEKHIKRMKSRKYLENIKKYPEMVDRLKERFR